VSFFAAVEAEGFAASGCKLVVSASSVGKAVGRLEARLGVKLLQRTTRSIALTAEGELLYTRSARILDDMREAEDAINQTRAAPRGRLKVSVPAVIGRRVIIPALPRFLDEYPEVELDVWLDDRKVDIVEEGYDPAIRWAPSTTQASSPASSRRIVSSRAVRRATSPRMAPPRRPTTSSIIAASDTAFQRPGVSSNGRSRARREQRRSGPVWYSMTERRSPRPRERGWASLSFRLIRSWRISRPTGCRAYLRTTPRAAAISA
jgi:DNA-binding transcriptional LysR family regulator